MDLCHLTHDQVYKLLLRLKQDDENWKVRLIEEEFMKHMWEAQE